MPAAFIDSDDVRALHAAYCPKRERLSARCECRKDHWQRLLYTINYVKAQIATEAGPAIVSPVAAAALADATKDTHVDGASSRVIDEMRADIDARFAKVMTRLDDLAYAIRAGLNAK